MRRKQLLGVLAVCCLGLAPLPSRALPLELPHVIRLTIQPAGKASVSQGEPFTFDVTMHNTLPLAMSGSLTITVASPDGAASKQLDGWTGILAPDATTTLERVVNPGSISDQLGFYRAKASGTFRLQQVPQVVLDSPSASLDFEVTRSSVIIPQFEEISSQLGIHSHMADPDCQDYAAGAAWGDVNGDGLLDLYVPQRNAAAQLWVNHGGTFVDEAALHGVLNQNADGSYPRGAGASFADYDNDGHPDLFVTNDGVSRLYHNNGDGTFADVSATAGINDTANHTSGSWGDYDGDGYLDLFVTAHGLRPSCQSDFTASGNKLWHNNGNGTFTNVTADLPWSGTDMGLGFLAAFTDYNHDGRPDIYLANDQVTPSHHANILWRNDGPGANGAWKWTDVSRDTDAGIGQYSMGIGIGDFNRDGRLDYAVSNIGPLALLRNDPNGKFVNVSKAAGIGDRVLETTWGIELLDLNNDGWDDVFVSSGYLNPFPGERTEYERDGVYVNEHTGHFADLSAPSHANDDGVGRGVAIADYDGDGKLDIVVVNLGGDVHVFHNITPDAGRWLEMSLKTKTGRDACGARVTAEFRTVDGHPITREVSCSSTGLSGTDDPTLHFGLGNAPLIQRVTIEWPYGQQQVLYDVAADQKLSLVEP